MPKSVSLQVEAFTKKISAFLKEAVSTKEMRSLGEEAVIIIVRRTRLGYGVTLGDPGNGNRFRLAPLSAKYIKQRTTSALSEYTSPKRSNLTRTGQMLDNLRSKTANKRVTLSFEGSRDDGKTNEEVARHVQTRRPFLNVTRLELNQLIRFYRKQFGDLRRRRFP